MRDLSTLFTPAPVRFDCAACASESQRRAPPRPAAAAPPRAGPATPLPGFTWEMLEQQLVDLAVRGDLQALARNQLRILRRKVGDQPIETVLRELLCLIWVVMDEEPPGGRAPTSAS